jgi:3-deoxy-manno-octulosonate cytidylyltransferase (CMP-KDO synthetase)
MKNPYCLGVIPVRMKSTRLPGKPLKDIAGKTLMQRVWEQAKKATLVTEVVIATDDQGIFEHANAIGARAVMTSDQHLTGSDRVAEVLSLWKQRVRTPDLIANIQGDMPFISPAVIDQTIQTLVEGGEEFGMSTVATPIESEEDFHRPAVVKVALANDGGALYFSRAPIPFWREPGEVKPTEAEPVGYKHMGLYVFRPAALERITTLPPSLPERREKLEQLRALCGGIRIKVAVVSNAAVQPSIEVDTPEDLARAIEAARGLGA